MRVKIGDKWLDSKNQPICIQVNETEQEQIASMDRDVATNGKYAIFPDYCAASGMTPKDMFKWMEG